MPDKFEQISLHQGFMKHNGGVMFRNISENEYEFKSKINENHLNAAGITHGGYIAALIDAGAGTAAHRSADNSPCVTISLDLQFISPSKVGDEILGKVKVLKKTKYVAGNKFSIADIDAYVTFSFAKWIKIDGTEKRKNIKKSF